MEIAASSASIDSGSKMQAYRRNGVAEYIIWQSFENQLEWYQLIEGEYRSLSPDVDGVVRSQVFPGLWLAVEAVLNNQMPQVLDGLQAGLRSPEHQAFLQQLGQC